MIDWRPLGEREPDLEEIWVETEKDVREERTGRKFEKK